MFSNKAGPTEKAPTKQGHLLKRGNKGLKQMRDRWFTLEVNTLSYYKNNKSGGAPLGFISLSQVVSLTPRRDAEEGTFEVKMENEGDKEGRIYTLRARSKQEMEDWINTMNESRAFYERGGLPLSGISSSESVVRHVQQKEREIEALSRSLQLTRNLLEKEKNRSVMILEVERAEANKMRESHKQTATELTEAKAQLTEKEKQLVALKGIVELSDSKEVEIQLQAARSNKPDEDLKEELECRVEELKEVKGKVKDKKERIRDLKKQLATANEVFTLTKPRSKAMTAAPNLDQSTESLSDSLYLMKEKMAEMKASLDKRAEELQEKLDAQVAENFKLESDSAQWKSMAQKELKARLNLETEKASLQRQLNSAPPSIVARRDSGNREASSGQGQDYEVPDYAQDAKPSGYTPMMVEGAGGDVYITRPASRNQEASADCAPSCTIQ